MKMSFSLLSISIRIFLNPCLKAVSIEADLRWAGRTFHTLLDEKRNILAPEVGGPRVVASTAAFHARVRGSVTSLGGLKETKMFLPHPRVKVSIVGSLRDADPCTTLYTLQSLICLNPLRNRNTI